MGEVLGFVGHSKTRRSLLNLLSFRGLVKAGNEFNIHCKFPHVVHKYVSVDREVLKGAKYSCWVSLWQNPTTNSNSEMKGFMYFTACILSSRALWVEIQDRNQKAKTYVEAITEYPSRAANPEVAPPTVKLVWIKKLIQSVNHLEIYW